LAFEFVQRQHRHDNPPWHELSFGISPLRAEAAFRFGPVNSQALPIRSVVVLTHPVH
jgi:hypothetical protein